MKFLRESYPKSIHDDFFHDTISEPENIGLVLSIASFKQFQFSNIAFCKKKKTKPLFVGSRK